MFARKRSLGPVQTSHASLWRSAEDFSETELYQVTWRPGSADLFPRPPSPARYLGAEAFAAAAPKAYVPGQGLGGKSKGGEGGGGGGAYRPPGAAKGTPAERGRSLAELAGEGIGGAAKSTRSMRRGGPVGGFVEEAPKSKNAAKNAKRKAKKKAEAAAKAAAAESDAAREGRAASLTPRPGTPGDAAAAPAPAPAADPAKEAKKILKKLRQIEQLKEKQAGGATLEATQLEKIGTEPKLRADLAALGEQ